jgi:hypothetical protein
MWRLSWSKNQIQKYKEEYKEVQTFKNYVRESQVRS